MAEILTVGLAYDGDGNLCPVKTALANTAASTTDGALVAAVAGKRIRVLDAFAIAAAATSVTFNSKPAGAGTAITPAAACGANGGFSRNSSQGSYLFQTNLGEGLTVTTGTGGTVGIQVSYIESA